MNEAIAGGHADMITLLVNEFGCDLKSNRRAMYKAVAGGHPELIPLLAGFGVDVNSGDSEECPALVVAARCKDYVGVKLLLDLGQILR